MQASYKSAQFSISRGVQALIIFSFCVLLTLISSGCPQSEQKTDASTGGMNSSQHTPAVSNGKLRVVCTTGMITDAAEVIGGEHVQVYGMMGPGVDPHLYQAKQSDVDALTNADVIFYNGLHLETKLGDILRKMARQTKVVEVTLLINKDELISWDESQELFDPHIWFDVTLWKHAVEAVRDGLCEADNEHYHYYDQRAHDYQAELDELHEYVKTKTTEVPEEQRVIVTAHDAFNYFGRAYGFEVVGLQGISTEAEAGTGDVQRLIDLIVQRQLPAIFIETSVSERNVLALKEGAAARGWAVEIGGELYSDAMGDHGTAEGTYSGMVRHNVDTIVNALSAKP